MLVQGNQSTYYRDKHFLLTLRKGGHTQCLRCQKRENDAITRFIPFKHLALHECLTRTLTKLLPHLLLRLAKCQSLWLREEVGKKNSVVFAVVDGVVRCGWCEEIGWDNFRPLMD